MVSAAPRSAALRRALRRDVSLRALVTGAIVVLMLAILASAVSTLLVRQRIDAIRDQSRTQLRPAQLQAGTLTTAYLDQETNQRGYLLTGGATYLAAYRADEVTISRLQTSLAELLTDFPAAGHRLDVITAAGVRWQAAARQQIALGGTPLTPAEVAAATSHSQRLLLSLRSDLDRLTGKLAQLLAQLIVRFDSAQSEADTATIVAVSLAVLTAALCLLAIRRLLTRPLKRLINNVRMVAGGAYQEPIQADGTGEIAHIADAVEGMRQNIVESTQALLEARHELTLRDERARMAADLHDLTLQNVFALGVRIDGLIDAQPALAAHLGPLLDDIAGIDRELRAIVYANGAAPTEGTLRARIATVTNDSRRFLGFVPALQLDGPLDALTGHPAADDLLAALRETLSNVARHSRATTATVTISLSPERILQLQVVDNGIGLPEQPAPGNGLRNLAARAVTHDGTVSTTSTPGNGTTIDWRISVPDPAPVAG